jgi:type I restriction enzyme S subunit
LVRFGDLLAEPLRNGVYKPKQYHGHGAKVINMKELFACDRIDDQGTDRVQLTSAELDRWRVIPGDLLFARRSFVLEGAGKCAIIGNPHEATTFESSMIRARLDPRKAVPRYIYYLFASAVGRAAMASIATRTAVSGITGKSLQELEIPVPAPAAQRKIVAILSAYDDLIESNNRRIGIMEEIAQRIYREWFVDFRYPGHEAVPLVESELGPLPQGWDVAPLFDVAEVAFGFPFKSPLFNTSDGEPVIRIRDIRAGESATLTTETPSSTYRVENGDILVGMDGDFHMARWSAGRAWLNQRVARFRPKSQHLSRYALYLSLAPAIQRWNATIVGTTVAHLGKSHLERINLVVPSDETAMMARDVLDPLFEQEMCLRQMNRVLRATRDLVLPRVISGEIDVSQFDIAVPDLAA